MDFQCSTIEGEKDTWYGTGFTTVFTLHKKFSCFGNYATEVLTSHRRTFVQERVPHSRRVRPSSFEDFLSHCDTSWSGWSWNQRTQQNHQNSGLSTISCVLSCTEKKPVFFCGIRRDTKHLEGHFFQFNCNAGPAHRTQNWSEPLVTAELGGPLLRLGSLLCCAVTRCASGVAGSTRFSPKKQAVPTS